MTTSSTVLIVPGLCEHVPGHWQTLLAASLPLVRTVPPLEQDKLSCAARVAALDAALRAIDGPASFWRVLRAQAQLIDAAGDSYRALRLAEAALYHAQRVRSRLGAARVQQLLASLCDKAGLGGKAERYRQAAINEMRSLGDRRATAGLLLTDTPSKGAVVVNSRIQDAITLTKEIGWTEGHERAKRKSNPPPNAKS
jgi:hypothetical protein